MSLPIKHTSWFDAGIELADLHLTDCLLESPGSEYLKVVETSLSVSDERHVEGAHAPPDGALHRECRTLKESFDDVQSLDSWMNSHSTRTNSIRL